MIKQSKISYVQLGLLAMGSAMMFPYTYLPILRQPPANQDVWISFLLSIIYMLVLNAPALFLINKFRGLNVNQINDTIAGKYAGKVVSMVLILFALFCFFACLIITVMFVNIYVLPETPMWAIVISMLVPISYASLKGAGTMGRLSLIIVPYIVLTIVIFFIMGFKLFDYRQLLPIMADSTLWDINLGAFFTAARYSEVLIILVLSFHLKQKDSPVRAYFLGIITFAIAFVLILMPVLMVLGPELAILSNNPYYTFTRQVGGADFIQRAQSVNVLAWFMGAIVKLMLFNYIASFMLKNMINKGKLGHYAIGLSVFAFLFLMIPIINKISFIHELSSDKIFPWIVFIAISIMPVILCIVYFIRRKKIAPRIEELRRLNENDSSID